MIPTKEKFEALYAEFGDDDRELAEAGFADYVVGLKQDRFVHACAKLDAREEQAFAEIGVNEDLAEWPEY